MPCWLSVLQPATEHSGPTNGQGCRAVRPRHDRERQVEGVRRSISPSRAMLPASSASTSVVSTNARTTSTATSGASRFRLIASTFASFQSRAPLAIHGSHASAARTPGTGTAIAANKVPGVRAALAWDPWIAKGARLWNDANVLAMSLKRLAPDVAVEVVRAFVETTEVDADEAGNIARLGEIERRTPST